MQLQKLISILIWVAVLCVPSVVSDIFSNIQKWELANKLNMLMHYSGWRHMDDVQIKKKKRSEIINPISEILEAVSLNREPVDMSNVLDKYTDIWTVLMCRYGEIIFNYKNLMNILIRVCQDEKDPTDSYQSYYDCFDSLLTKIDKMTPRFQCMTDALEFMSSIGPQTSYKYLLPGMQKLTDYTLTLRSNTLLKLEKHGTNVDVVDQEIVSIGEIITDVFTKKIYWFTFDHCKVPKNTKWQVLNLTNDFVDAKNSQLIPRDTTMMQYVENKYDDYVNEIMGKWFYDLGFAYGANGRVTLGTN